MVNRFNGFVFCKIFFSNKLVLVVLTTLHTWCKKSYVILVLYFDANGSIRSLLGLWISEYSATLLHNPSTNTLKSLMSSDVMMEYKTFI
jgi:hypothetical protein